jgi:putative FmdB family regulatory protein
MPIYEYRCSKCGDVFEVRQKFADAPLTVHEGCGGTVERLISASGFNFKGTGWYVTDYARGGSKSKKDSDGDQSKTESKPAESKPADSKPAESKSSETKTETKPAGSSTKKD